jgi:multiple sugar transport system substrate-binding protein
MRRLWIAAAVAGLVATACSAGGGGSATPSAVNTASHPPVTLTITGEWTGRECSQWKTIFAGFTKQYPWATVDPLCNINDDKLIARINAGNAPDVAQSFGVDNVGLFCHTGAWTDLNPYINGPDGLDTSVFPPAALTYTQFQDEQCALPFMTDSFGIYYNTDYFSQAGISGPPKTTDELEADAKKLTVFNSDGSIKRAGFVPLSTYYCCAANALDMGYMFNAQYLDSNGRSAFASDPNWAKMFEWQHQFIADVYGNGDFQTGADKLAEFVSGAGGEWGNNQDFATGRVAITIDGEWRNAFIKDANPNLNYDTAPLPTSPDSTDRYGGGPTGGTVLALPKGSPHPNEAWLLLRFLATDTPTLVYMANNVNNVPTTLDAINSPDLKLPPQFNTFMEVFQNPNSGWAPTTPIGTDIETYIGQFMEKWQAGKTTDLQGGLQAAADQTNQALDQAQTP